jgi:hypothetical protein
MTNNASKGVDESVWAVGNPVEDAVTKQQSKNECAGEEPSQEECGGPQAGWLRPADLPPI